MMTESLYERMNAALNAAINEPDLDLKELHVSFLKIGEWIDEVGILEAEIARLKAQMFLKCLRCGHQWLRRTADRPKQCPKCKQTRWDVRPAWTRKKP